MSSVSLEHNIVSHTQFKHHQTIFFWWLMINVWQLHFITLKLRWLWKTLSLKLWQSTWIAFRLNLKNSDKFFLKFAWSYMKVWLSMLRNNLPKVMIYQQNIFLLPVFRSKLTIEKNYRQYKWKYYDLAHFKSRCFMKDEAQWFIIFLFGTYSVLVSWSELSSVFLTSLFFCWSPNLFALLAFLSRAS